MTDEDDEDERVQALVERIQQACAGEPLYRVIGGLVEELCEAILKAPPQDKALEHTLAVIRKYVEDG